MSLSLFVVLALEAQPNTNDLNKQANESDYNIVYEEHISLNTHTGFLPAKINGQETGVELYFFKATDLPNQFTSSLPEEYSKGVVYQLRFGGNPIEAQAAFTTAIIMGMKYNGLTIEDQAGTLLSVNQLSEALQHFSVQ